MKKVISVFTYQELQFRILSSNVSVIDMLRKYLTVLFSITKGKYSHCFFSKFYLHLFDQQADEQTDRQALYKVHLHRAEDKRDANSCAS